MPRREGNGRPQSQGIRRRLDRRLKYQVTKKLYKKKPKVLTDHIWKGTNPWDKPSDHARPEDKAVINLYKDLWGRAGSCRITKTTQNPIQNQIPPRFFTREEVIERVKNRGKGASGIDGLLSAHLKRKGIDLILANTFNILTALGHFPAPWKEGRTVLIQKDGKDPKKAENWRPITISSLLCRTYTGLPETRLRETTKLHQRQKGFVPGQGCAQNCLILQGIIEEIKVKWQN